MAKKLLIVMVNTDPANGSELGPPLFQATIAAAMDYDVEMIFTGRAGELVKQDVATTLYPSPGSSKSVYDHIREAHEAGVRFKVCAPTLDLWGEDLIPEVEETIGGAYVISEAMDPEVVTFTY